MGSLKNKTVSAMMWTTVGKFGTLIIQFISNMVLARLLMPADFGVIGMLTIFITVSEVFITAGFGQALIQKKNPTHIDYTTVFYWNLVASIFIYIILYLCAPAIAAFYNMPVLTAVLRVQSLVLVISGFSIVQNNQLQKQLDFKKLYTRAIVSAISGTIVAVIMAFKGFGVWSLVASSLTSSVVGVLLLWRISSWRPTLEFSWASFKELFSFGSLMAVSSVVDQVYQEIQGLIIGKFYSAASLGYYSQAKKLQNIPNSSLSQIVSQVTFPVFAELQDDKVKLKAGVRKIAKSVTYLNFPLMLCLFSVGPSLIRLVYGEKWDVSIPYFQILCLTGMFYTILTTNNSVIRSLGKSGIFLKVRLIQRSIGIVLILIGAFHSVYGILVAMLVANIINYLIVSYYTAKLIGYGLVLQLKDIYQSFLLSVFTALVTYSITFVGMPFYFELLVQLIVFVAVFILGSSLFKIEAYMIYKSIILEKLKR